MAAFFASFEDFNLKNYPFRNERKLPNKGTTHLTGFLF